MHTLVSIFQLYEDINSKQVLLPKEWVHGSGTFHAFSANYEPASVVLTPNGFKGFIFVTFRAKKWNVIEPDFRPFTVFQAKGLDGSRKWLVVGVEIIK